MNGTLATGQRGLASDNVNKFGDINWFSVLEVAVTFGAAIILASALKSRACLLHGVLNVLLVVYCQGVPPQSKGSLLVFILAAVMIWNTVQIWLREPKRKNVNIGNGRPAARLEYHEQEESKAPQNHDESEFLRPMIFPSRTTHRRFFPTQHAFSYSYLLVGIPVSNTLEMAPNTMLSIHPYVTPKHTSYMARAWFSVNAFDYLQRGRAFSNSTLRHKLDQYLESEGVKPDVYPHAYLVTAPCFLGFSFNPVSFWYLYDKSKTLAAMILEVNNTFDERRMYLLQRSGQPSNEMANTEEPGTGAAGKYVRFTQAWAKDFHVSPFNDRDGSYSVTVSDVVAAQTLDNTIVLRSDDDKAKIVARIYSAESGIDPASLSLVTRLVFLLRWFWVGLMTNPRILKEARALWVKKLRVFYRPEPLRSSIGRNETPEETVIEQHFRRMLHALAKGAGVTVQYWPAAGDQRGHGVMLGENSNEIASTTTTKTVIKLHILTPEFYSELAREHGTMPSLFERICFQNNNNNSSSSSNNSSSMRHSSSTNNPLAWTDNEDTIRKVLIAGRNHRHLNVVSLSGKRSSVAVGESGRLSQLEYAVSVLRRQGWSLRRTLLWIVVRRLGFQCADQEFTLSDMDGRVKGMAVDNRPGQEYREYLWCVLEIILADRLAFGFRALFTLEVRVVRFVAVVFAVQLMRLCLRMALGDLGALMENSSRG